MALADSMSASDGTAALAAVAASLDDGVGCSDAVACEVVHGGGVDDGISAGDGFGSGGLAQPSGLDPMYVIRGVKVAIEEVTSSGAKCRQAKSALRLRTWDNVDTVIGIPVTFAADAPFKSLHDASVEVRIRDSRAVATAGAFEVTAADNMIVIIPRGTLAVGVAQCNVLLDHEQQTFMLVSFELDVLSGIKPL